MKAVTYYTVVFSIVKILYGQHYDDTHTIFKNIMNSSRYHPDVVPVLNQSAPIYVTVDFNIISIVSVDDITQSFICNGIFSFYWTDEVCSLTTFYFKPLFKPLRNENIAILFVQTMQGIKRIRET